MSCFCIKRKGGEEEQEVESREETVFLDGVAAAPAAAAPAPAATMLTVAAVAAFATARKAAFSGPPIDSEQQGGEMKKEKKKEKKNTITSAQIAAAGAVVLDGDGTAAWEAEEARLLEASSVAQVLAPDGQTAAVPEVMLFIDRLQSSGAVLEQQGVAVTAWLINAIELAPYNPAVQTLVYKLLGAQMFTANLNAIRPQQWQPLRTASTDLLKRIGTLRLKSLFDQHDLGNELSDAVLLPFLTYHPQSPHAISAAAAAAAATSSAQPAQPAPQPTMEMLKPSQRSALPALYELLEAKYNYDGDYGALPERKSLLSVLMLFALIENQFQNKINKLFEDAEWCDISHAPTKGYARSFVKIYKDYVSLPSPKAQWILDGLRVLLTASNTVGMCAILQAISDAFGGIIQLKNPFSLDESAREDRCHLLLLNCIVMFDLGMTVGDLVNGPAAEKVIADFMNSQKHGEPTQRWKDMVQESVDVLRDPLLASARVKVFAEIQFTLTAFFFARMLMHFPYDIIRASDCKALWENFKGLGAGGGAVMAAAVDETTVFRAAQEGQVVVVRRLLAGGADVDEVSRANRGMTGLFVAAQNNHPDVVAELVESGADLNKATYNGTTPVYIAAEEGHAEVVKQLVGAGADVGKARTDNGQTPLFIAAQKGFVAVVKVLVAAGADVEKAKSNTETPLHKAAYKGHVEIVKVLLAAGANRVAPSNFGTPVEGAIEQGHSEVVALLQ